MDVLREVRAAKEAGRPYVVAFVGVNGVGKSTNLSKVAYWLAQHDVRVMIAACDTFRAGAVQQLRTHCKRLDVPLFERGYEKDPSAVASEAIRAAQRAGVDAVLIDTAGRMQDNEPLMRALAKLRVGGDSPGERQPLLLNQTGSGCCHQRPVLRKTAVSSPSRAINSASLGFCLRLVSRLYLIRKQVTAIGARIPRCR